MKRVHMINTSKYDFIGDCILIENDGKFALIDTGECGQDGYGQPTWTDNGDNPGTRTYLKNIMGDVTHFEWILITHCHSDHIGNLVSFNGKEGGIFNPNGDSEWSVGTLYLREYDMNRHLREDKRASREWNNTKLYNHVKEYLNSHSEINWVKNNFPETISLGDMIIDLPNANEEPDISKCVDENVWSICAAIYNQDKSKCFLSMGDYQNEQEEYTNCFEDVFYKNHILNKINPPGGIDVMKIGHHGFKESTHEKFLEQVKPKVLFMSSSFNMGNGQILDAVPPYIIGYKASEIGAPIVASCGEIQEDKFYRLIKCYNTAGVPTAATGSLSAVYDFADNVSNEDIPDFLTYSPFVFTKYFSENILENANINNYKKYTILCKAYNNIDTRESQDYKDNFPHIDTWPNTRVLITLNDDVKNKNFGVIAYLNNEEIEEDRGAVQYFRNATTHIIGYRSAHIAKDKSPMTGRYLTGHIDFITFK